MGNELADAIRAELRMLLVAKFGNLESAAVALGIPYKTLYRYLTVKGKDRAATVPLDFALDASRVLGRDFTSVYNRAAEQVAANVPASLDDLDELPDAEEQAARRGDYGLAAYRGNNEADIESAD